jgi:hypothetical protein
VCFYIFVSAKSKQQKVFTAINTISSYSYRAVTKCCVLKDGEIAKTIWRIENEAIYLPKRTAETAKATPHICKTSTD